MAQEQVILQHVTKRFTTRTMGTVTAVDDFNLAIKEGECFSFLGPSGCGKTTTLRMIAGFEDLSEGEIHLRQTGVGQIQESVCAARGEGAGNGVPGLCGVASYEYI